MLLLEKRFDWWRKVLPRGRPKRLKIGAINVGCLQCGPGGLSLRF